MPDDPFSLVSASLESGGQKACHNCRRRRRRCDRSQPVCRKCTSNGEECLGYGNLFRWTNAVASRGRMAGLSTFGEAPGQPEPPLQAGKQHPDVLFSLIDPLLQDLGSSSRYYIRHCMLSAPFNLTSLQAWLTTDYQIPKQSVETWSLSTSMIATHFASWSR